MRGEERRQRPMLMVLNVEQRIAKDHPLLIVRLSRRPIPPL
jgi:hypothetical protein